MEDKKTNKQNKEKSPEMKRLYTSILLVMLALVCITAATVAWFTIADRTKVKSMNMEVTTGTNLRFDLDAHDTFDEYIKTLYFEQIADRVLKDKGYDMRTTSLEPVTTTDYSTFTLENGTVVQDDTGAYLEFTLHFMATQDMLVHLTSTSSTGKNDGTSITSDNANLADSMRISFEADGITYIYDPGMGASSIAGDNSKTFGLASAGDMVLNDDNALFFLREGVDKTVVVHVWLEGTDEKCTDELRGADYAIRLRFLGTDKDNNPLDGTDE
jgi:hypothetical protein